MGSSAVLFTPAVGLAMLRVLALLLPALPLAAAWRQIGRDRAAGRAGLRPLLEIVAILSGVLAAPALLRACSFAGQFGFDAIFAPDGPWHLSFRGFVAERAVPLLWAPLQLARLLDSGAAGPDIERGSLLLGTLALLAVLLPPLATIGITIFIGWLFLLSGVMGLVATFWARPVAGFWWSLLSALIGIAAGLVLVASPIGGAVSLTLVMIVFFVIEGVATIMYALDHRNELSGRWGWMLVSGIIDLALAAMILVGLPGTAAWALGLLVGINMIFGGSALLAMGLHARKAAA